jgi:energy-coupling factor transporter ATP-binding protein EcfA2
LSKTTAWTIADRCSTLGCERRSEEAAEHDYRPMPTEQTKNNTRPTLKGVSVVKIRLENLFGRYTYDIPGENGALTQTPILYGENGVGKTNILKILFHLLSPAKDRGHRTALNELKFTKAEVQLSNDVTVSAIRPSGRINGSFRFEVNRGTGDTRVLLGAWNWAKEGDPTHSLLSAMDASSLHTLSDRSSPKEKAQIMQSFLLDLFERESNPKETEDAFLSALRDNVPPIYLLAAERSIRSDELRAAPQTRGEVAVEIRDLLPDALMRTSRKLIQAGIRAASQGTTSTHTIYRDLVRRLTTRSRIARSDTENANLTQKLMELSAQYAKYERYGLTPLINGAELVDLLSKAKGSTAEVAYDILAPYVEGLTEQSKTLDQAYETIDSFVATTNQFLFDKRIEFRMADGAQVKSARDNTVIDPKVLSSGEQQLLLLFCHVVNASDAGGIFIIDEPELSLNVRWQRQLINALRTLDRTGNIQFIFASHSMEFLAKHRSDVVRLRGVGSGRVAAVDD